MTQLDELIELIAPANTFDEVSSRANEALNAFHVDSSVVDDWDDFLDLMSRLYTHLENTILGIGNARRMNREQAWHRCVMRLNESYGPAGAKAAFEMARTGNEGGLRAVMRALADKLIEHYANREISARVGRFMAELMANPKQGQATIREYLEKYGHLLPGEITEGHAARIGFNFQAVLEKHPLLVRRLRQVGR